MYGDCPEKPFQQDRRAVLPSIPTKGVAGANQMSTRHWQDAPLCLEVACVTPSFSAASR